jgi:hypothetical protein
VQPTAAEHEVAAVAQELVSDGERRTDAALGADRASAPHDDLRLLQDASDGSAPPTIGAAQRGSGT